MPLPPQTHSLLSTSPITQNSQFFLFSLSRRCPARTCQEVDCKAAGAEGW